MTTLISSDLVKEQQQEATNPRPIALTYNETEHTIASSFIILMLCMAIVLSTLAYGTVHSWSLAFFQAGAAIVTILWVADAWDSKRLRISTNILQLPLIGLFLIGLVQILPLGLGTAIEGLSTKPVQTLSIDPYSTRFALIQIASLFIYFAATLAFIDSPRRLRLLVNTIIIFGFILAILGLTQSYTSPEKIFWIRDIKGAIPFGPFINRHHFAAYMELTLLLPLGLLFTGAIEVERRVLYGFAIVLMAIALIATGSRGAIVGLVAALFFLSVVSSVIWRRKEREGEKRRSTIYLVLTRLGIGLLLIIAILIGALYFGGEESLSRIVGTINSQDPSSGRLYFWKISLSIIRDNPIIGVGLGAFGLAFTKYDTNNGLYRVEQAHNDYLQVLTDTGIVGALVGLFFLAALFYLGLKKLRSGDKFRRGISMGALAGCFAVLVHSFFEFSLHTTSNALLFLVFVALATTGKFVEDETAQITKRKRRRRKRHSTPRETTINDQTEVMQSPNKDAELITQ
jgi:O-antigen ligase